MWIAGQSAGQAVLALLELLQTADALQPHPGQLQASLSAAKAACNMTSCCTVARDRITGATTAAWCCSGVVVSPSVEVVGQSAGQAVVLGVGASQTSSSKQLTLTSCRLHCIQLS
jgi:hypothetical protein